MVLDISNSKWKFKEFLVFRRIKFCIRYDDFIIETKQKYEVILIYNIYQHFVLIY